MRAFYGANRGGKGMHDVTDTLRLVKRVDITPAMGGLEVVLTDRQTLQLGLFRTTIVLQNVQLSPRF